MRFLQLLPAILACFFLSATCFAQDPHQYVSQQDFFRVDVPCEFEVHDIEWLSEYGSPLPGRVYRCSSGPETYSATVINYTDILDIRAAQPHTEAASSSAYARIDTHASVDFAAAKLREEAASTTVDRWHLIDMVPGHQLEYVNQDGTRSFAGIYLHEYRLYILHATAPAATEQARMFPESLGFLDANGSRIRYDSLYLHPW